MSTPFKDMPKGGCIYALVKGDKLEYKEGKLVNVGVPRVEMGKDALTSPRTVVDVTYSFGEATYTDVAEVTMPMLQTTKLGALALVATDSETILKEVRATLKTSENYVKEAKTEVPKNEKRIEQCKELIGQLDTAFAEKQEFEQRISKLENSSAETNKLLNQILKKLDK